MIRLIRLVGGPCAALALLIAPAIAQESGGRGPIPSFQELEAAGAVIGEIRIDSQNVFDLNDPRENNLFYRFGNALHVPTRTGVLRRALLFRSGEPLSARLIEESERLLRGYHYIHDVRIRAIAYRGGVVDIEVATRDSWTLDPAIKFTRQGGANTSGIGLKETNFLGTGVTIGMARESDVDRKGREFSIAHNHAFGGRTAIEYSHAGFNDGNRDAFKLERPFYALDTRWAAGVSASKHGRIDSLFSGGAVAGQYRRQSDLGEIYGGLSAGLVDGWTHRYSLGVEHQNDTYRVDPALPVPAQVPLDRKLVAPFVRYEAVEDDFRKARNLDRVERTEYLPMGFNLRLQLGRAMAGLGSTRDLWLYSANVSDGIAFAPDHNLLTAAYAKGQYGSGGGEHQFVGTEAKYYYKQGRRGTFFASISVDAVTNGDASDQLLLGGDSGLRGYPLRYQTGAQRALLTLEQRFYTEWFPFRLFRVGAAVFYDHGRAWGGASRNAANPGWLRDVGIGLRVFSDRSATGRVMHIDLAFPLDHDPAIRSRQVLFRSKASF